MIRGRSIVVCTSIVGAVFLAALFVRIDRPLMWNDEADTAMYAQRITEVGYPKVHHGKHALYTVDETGIGINREFDAYVNAGWLQYYVAVPGVLLARHVSDPYLRTAILRFPFALIGSFGVLLFGIAIGQALPHRRQRLWFSLAYAVAVTLSVTLLLHLREVRYYSISIFLCAAWFWSFVRYFILGQGKTHTHVSLQFATYVLLFLTFYPLTFIAAATTVAYASSQWWRHRSNVEIARRARSLLLGVCCFALCSIPLLWFFRTLPIAKYFNESSGFSIGHYFMNLGTLLSDFERHELFGLAILLQVLLLLLYRQARWLSGQADFTPARQVWALLAVFTGIYVVAIAQSPLFHQRYYLALYPVLASTIALTLVMLCSLVPILLPRSGLRTGTVFLGGILGTAFLANFLVIFPLLWGLAYERTHTYWGPLDYLIPYIQTHYAKPAELTVATNYEEHTLMYYLDSRILIGQYLPWITEETLGLPDLIVQRKTHGLIDPGAFDVYRRRAMYTPRYFPIEDTSVNTIPETQHPLYHHLFRTPLTDDPTKQLVLEIRL